MPPLTRAQVSVAVSQLMPNIIRGVQLDFFLKRRTTQTQLLVLLAIRAYGRCSMGTLAHNMHVSMPTASGIVGRLVGAGFLRRCPPAQDRRRVIVELTESGRLYIQKFQDVIRRRWEEVLKSLNGGELEAFYRIITKLRDQMERRPA